MNTAYLALGSNLGDRSAHLAKALRGLQLDRAIQVVRCSSVYETAPVGLIEQPDFLNLVAEIRTTLLPEGLLARCLAVEAELGRVRRERWGPRIIDIDVLWFNDMTFSSPTLTLPHPRMLERSFVLIPLAELAPQLLIGGETVVARASRFGETELTKVGPLPLSSSPP